MKVAFPSNNQQTIASHIGLAKGFLIIDTDTNEKFYIENPVLKKIQEEHINLKNTNEGQRGLGTGRVIPPLLKEAGVDVLISNDFGEGMVNNLEFEGIKAIETENKNIEEILNQIKEDEMKEITNINDTHREFGRGMGYGRGQGLRRAGFGRRCNGRGFRRGFGARNEEEFENRAQYFRRGQGLGRGFNRGFGRKWED